MRRFVAEGDDPLVVALKLLIHLIGVIDEHPYADVAARLGRQRHNLRYDN